VSVTPLQAEVVVEAEVAEVSARIPQVLVLSRSRPAAEASVRRARVRPPSPPRRQRRLQQIMASGGKPRWTVFTRRVEPQLDAGRRIETVEFEHEPRRRRRAQRRRGRR